MEEGNNKCEVTILENGPMIINGNLEIKNPDGSVESKKRVAMCRCGASTNKPYCDGNHKKIEFVG